MPRCLRKILVGISIRTLPVKEPLCNGNFDCDQDVDGTDAAKFKEDFGRNQYSELPVLLALLVPGVC